MNEEELIQEARKLIGRWDNVRVVGQGWSGDSRRGFQFNPIRTRSEAVATPVTPTGACCPVVGDCFVTSQAICELGGGAYQGDGPTCDPDPCTDTGGCCNFFTGCTIKTRADCEAAFETYLGDRTTCTPPPDCTCCPLFDDVTTVTVSGTITGCPLSGTITFPPETWTKVAGPVVALDEFTTFGCGITVGNKSALCGLATEGLFRTTITDCTTTNVASLVVDFGGICGPFVTPNGCAVSCEVPDDAICSNDMDFLYVVPGINDYSFTDFGLTFNVRIILA